MSTTTTNLGLIKPELTDAADITAMNENWDKIDTELKDAEDHASNKSNPHGVTASQVGLGNVNNTADTDKPVSTAQATAIADAKAAGTTAQTNLDSHTANKSNPHGVTAAQAGALPSAGGTMSGTIEFKKAENGYGRLAKNHGSDVDYGMYLTDVDINGNTFKLILSANGNNVYVVPNDNSGQYRLFGEHNKQLMRDNVFDASTADLTAGSSVMTTGKLYFVYE